MQIISRLKNALVELLFPPHCYACGDSSPELNLKFGICNGCWEGLRPVGPSICATCGKSLASPEAEKGWTDYKCEDCRSAKRIPYAALRSLYRYDSPMREMIHLFKFEGMLPLGQELGRELAEAISNLPSLFSELDAVVPVPLHPYRRFRRGFNQSAVLAEILAKRLNVPLIENGLFRVRNTPPQSSLQMEKRRRGLREAFTVRTEVISDKSLLLVDDVVTTETTVRECSRVLKKAGANRVLCVTVARAEMM